MRRGLIVLAVLLGGCGSGEPSPGDLAESVRGALDRVYEEKSEASGRELKTSDASCREGPDKTWNCTVIAGERLEYEVSIDAEDCWRGRLVSARETSSRSIPVQVEIVPRTAVESIRGCL